MDGVLLLDSITDAGPQAAGRVVVSGSHGGLYPGALASLAGVRAVIFNDAGIGCERAGIAGIAALGAHGTAAAAVDCMSCHIGSATSMIETGRISFANEVAGLLGVAPGMAVAEAVSLLAAAEVSRRRMAKPEEARSEVTLPGGVRVVLLDSASLVLPSDAGRIIVTGSHGGLLGGDPARALKADGRLAVFNDAGMGRDRIGISRLPALDARGIAGVAVSHRTARIGDARSALETGRISAVNRTARWLGLDEGAELSAALDALA